MLVIKGRVVLNVHNQQTTQLAQFVLYGPQITGYRWLGNVPCAIAWAVSIAMYEVSVIRSRLSGIFPLLLLLSVYQRMKLFLSVFFSALDAVQVSP